ncbi:MAG: M24 family metallopeptidase, partial [Kangiellaceae bacterium]|nr:M24 family metallopeptidase [Kangiellaceae bacterium]
MIKKLLCGAIVASLGFANGLIFAAEKYDFKGDSPWPEIRKQRISELLPKAMAAAEVDVWLVLCRENNNDPLADHVGCENAGAPAAYLFYFDNQGFHSLVYSPSSEATALDELNIHDTVVAVPRGQSAIQSAVDFIVEKDFKKIAVNMSDTNAQADGLSYSQYKMLSTALGKNYIQRLVSATDLVYEWLSVKLPAEVDIMRQAAELTAKWQLDVYQQVIPGKSTDADIARLLKQKMADAGVGDAWAPDQNPNVNSGPDRGHSHATDKVIMPGDVIQIDFGIKVYDRWVTDIQRFAYVLKPGEKQPPKDIRYYWE